MPSFNPPLVHFHGGIPEGSNIGDWGMGEMYSSTSPVEMQYGQTMMNESAKEKRKRKKVGEIGKPVIFGRLTI